MAHEGTKSTESSLTVGRRELLGAGAGAAALGALRWPFLGAAQERAWNAGDVAHLIPTASHDRFLIKASFKTPLAMAPRLALGGTSVVGVRSDPRGRFWRFDAPALTPATQYELRITDAGGAPLCDPWPLKTFPAPDATPERLRLVAYTCEGGYDGPRFEGKTTYLDMTARRRLLARALSFKPDVLIANGDHLYWDMKTSQNKPFAQYVREQVWGKFGTLDLSVPMLHPRNAATFLGVCDEAVLYDCRRYLDYKADHAKVVPQRVEDWLLARTRAEDTTHFFHAPSLPFAYSSGKLGDWYPDLLDAEAGRLVLYREKEGWQRGWFAQHQRLVEALAAQKQRAAVIVQGDFHASAAGKMLRSGELTLARPVHVVMAGTLGTGDLAFPSAFRSVESTPSELVGMEQALAPTEKNGFSVIDVTPDKLVFTLFMWRPPQPIGEIDTMKPALTYEVRRKG